jgi:hypothetical protein
MENIVSCQGSDCNVCSLLETISNLYNYILGTSFALAVLILIIAGFAYLGSTGNKIFLEKSRLFLKGVLFGFVFILLGWLIIHAIIKFSGYINAGAWWQFRCNTENQQESIINDETDSYFSPFYKNLTVFPDLRSFLASGVEKGKVNGPLDQSSFAAQIQSLRDGEMLHFLAPVRLESTTGENEDLFLPLITLRKEGSDIVLENTGEYWDVFANKFKKSNSVTLNSLEIDGIIEPILIDSNGIPLENKADFDLISADIVKNLGKYVDGGDRTASKTESLSDLIAGAGDPKEKFNNIVSPLTIDFQKMVGSLIVERESSQKVPSFLQSQVDSCSNLMNTP